ncbi:MAG: hypothetical protein DRP58_12690 [Spirochaetes bacterium]|nr:MAG: hypothetical protein DRP58_12690 [Spirochaetota bacterium]
MKKNGQTTLQGTRQESYYQKDSDTLQSSKELSKEEIWELYQHRKTETGKNLPLSNIVIRDCL